MLEYDFSMKNATVADVEKFIISTEEFKLASTRILALGTLEPVEFVIERNNYMFDVIIKKTEEYGLKNNYPSEFEFKIKLFVDIKLFDTTKVIYLPAHLSEIEVVGNTVDTKFETDMIGGLLVTDSQEIIIEPYAFTGIKVKTSPMFISLVDKEGNSIPNQLFKDCYIDKVRHVYSFKSYMDYISLNKIGKFNNLHLEYKIYELFENENFLKEQFENIKNVKNISISTLFINSSLIDFKFNDYVNDVLKVIYQFKSLKLEKDTMLSVTFIPGIFMNMYNISETDKSMLKQLVSNNSDTQFKFEIYMS